ncbi:MAG: hypothetical protein ACYDAD_09870 [Acidimicrobiales bacterium]
MRRISVVVLSVVVAIAAGGSPAAADTTATIAGCPATTYVIPQQPLQLAFGTDAGTQNLGPCSASHSYVAVAAFLYALPLNSTAGGRGERTGPGGVLVASTFGYCHQAGGCTGAQTDASSAILPPGLYQVTAFVGVWDTGGPQTSPPTSSGYFVDQRFLYNGFGVSPF